MLADLCRIAQEAGEKILEVRRSAVMGTRLKGDQSPVTQADLLANECIVTQLARLSSLPIVSEESSPDQAVGESFWLVDPLDGTKDFVAGKDSFVVNIGLIERGRPVLGVVYAPVSGELFWAEAGKGAYKGSLFTNGQRIFNRSQRVEFKALASGSLMTPRLQGFLDALHITHLQRYGSALKICRVAEGEADLYPRFGETHEWDTAAGHAILNEAGCKLVDMASGQELRYGKPGFLNGGFIVSRTDLDFVEKLGEIRAQFAIDSRLVPAGGDRKE